MLEKFLPFVINNNNFKHI